MTQDILKYKLVERYLNKVEFNEIAVGSLIGQYYAMNVISKQHSEKVFTNLLMILKYGITLWYNKKIRPYKADFIFTKLNNRFHFNALMDPLICHFGNKSIILCDETSLDKTKYHIQDLHSRIINFKQTNSNIRNDAFKITATIFTAFYLLVKNRQRLQLTFSELFYFINNLLVQLRRTSFWDHYMTVADHKPLCVVTEFDRSSEAVPLIVTARKHKIPTITLIHGVLEDYSFTPFQADYIFCWGEGQKTQLIDKRIDPKRIIITGNPMFNYEKQNNHSEKKAPGSINICLAISPGFDNRLLIKPFKSALKHFENARGIIKLHPSLIKDEFKWVETISSNIEVLASTEITNENLFRKIDLLIINDSGIANEALAAGVPVLVLLAEGTSQLNDFQNELINIAGCQLVTNESELFSIFNQITTDTFKFRSEAVNKSIDYMKNLFETTGTDAVNSMISKIDEISERKLQII